MPRIRAAAILASLLVIAATHASTAGANTVTKTVPAQYVQAHAQNPDDPGNCSAIAFAQWADVPGVTSATVHYNGRYANGNLVAMEETRAAPFDDTYQWVATYVVPSGSHWIALGKSWADGPGVNDCSDMSARMATFYEEPVTVELTIEDSAACVAARSGATKASSAIATLKRQLKHARGGRRASLSRKLSRAKRAFERERQAIATRCP